MSNNENDKSEDKEKRQSGVWVGFDLGGTKMLAVVFDEDYNILGKKRRKTRDKDKDGNGTNLVD